MDLATRDIPKEVIRHLEAIEPEQSWTQQGVVVQTVKDIERSFDSDRDLASKSLDIILSLTDGVCANTQKTLDLLTSWQDGSVQFSTTSMMAYVIEKFDFDEAAHKIHINALLIAAILADLRNDLPYHNTLHYRKVLLHTVRLIAVHNHLFKGSDKRTLDHDAMTKLMISACIHDLGHAGTGNIIERKYQMAMTEQRSFDLAYPYLAATGLSEDILADIRIMLITTDVSPLGDPISPMQQARAAYKLHFGMNKDDDDEPLYSQPLEILKEDERLCLLCVLLHEADIMNSAGVDYEITRKESVAINQEMGESLALPEDTLLFLNKICGDGFLSDAARYLADGNLIRIKARVMDDYKNGNNSYF